MGYYAAIGCPASRTRHAGIVSVDCVGIARSTSAVWMTVTALTGPLACKYLPPGSWPMATLWPLYEPLRGPKGTLCCWVGVAVCQVGTQRMNDLKEAKICLPEAIQQWDVAGTGIGGTVGEGVLEG